MCHAYVELHMQSNIAILAVYISIIFDTDILLNEGDESMFK